MSDVHTLSVKQYGNPEGAPVLFVHGGPVSSQPTERARLTSDMPQGGGTDDKDAQRFAPDKYRIVLFDQRGAGDSTPASCLEDNTTAHLIKDMEQIREHLQIGDSWHVFGGSWGEPVVAAVSRALADLTLDCRLHALTRICSSSP